MSGTSIGALNAAIIAAAHREHSVKNSAQELENFWLELAETLILLPAQFSSTYFKDEATARFSQVSLASMYSAIYGNPFLPTWITSDFFLIYLQPFRPLPYPLFDIAPLTNTLSRYVGFTNLRN